MNDQDRLAAIERLRHEIEVTEAALKRADDEERIAEQDFATRGPQVEITIYDTHRKPIYKQGPNPSIRVINDCRKLHKHFTKKLAELRARLETAEKPESKWAKLKREQQGVLS